jgi:hypothetical protein
MIAGIKSEHFTFTQQITFGLPKMKELIPVQTPKDMDFGARFGLNLDPRRRIEGIVSFPQYNKLNPCYPLLIDLHCL